MEKFFEIVSYKHVLAVVFTLMCIMEIRSGFLKPLKSYLKTISLKPFLWLLVMAVMGALLILPFDSSLILKIQGHQHPLLDPAVLWGASMGKANGAWGPLAVLYFIFYFARSPKAREWFFGAVLSSALTGLAAHILKFIMMRARPYNNLGPFHFFDIHGFMQDDRAFQSFPSGDVAIASGAAAFLFLSLRPRSFSWLFLLIPLLTAFSRIDLNKHWPSDTAFAFLISFTLAKFTLDYIYFLRARQA